MHLHASICPSPPQPPLLRLLPRRASSCSGVPLALRPGALLLMAERLQPRGVCAVNARCLISQVQSYGAVDYERRPWLKWSTLYRRISVMENPVGGSSAVLEHWEYEERRRLSKWDLCRVIKELRKFGRFKRALEVYDWMTSQEDRFTFNSSDNAIKLDLIAKVRGIPHAEEYFSSLPESSKDKRTYGALLNAYSQAKTKEKAEATIEIMKDKGYAYDALPYNVMMTLYMNVEHHEEVYAVINEMKEKNVPFDTYSYNIWITNCATSGDVEEMERVVKELIADTHVNVNWTTYTTLATMYTRLNDTEKALNCLKEAELRMTGRDRTPFNYLLGLYSSIGKRDEVYRVWKHYKSNFHVILNSGYQSMLSGLIKLDDVGGAEKIYEEWFSTSSKLDPRICNIVVRLFVREGRVGDAKRILDRFIEKGGKPKPLSWEILAEGCINCKQIPEAVSCMKAAASHEGLSKWRPKIDDVVKIAEELCTEGNSKESVLVFIDVLRITDCLQKEEYASVVTRMTETYSQKPVKNC